MTGLNVGAVIARFQADISHFKRGVDTMRKQVTGLRSHVNTMGNKITSGFKSMSSKMAARFSEAMQKVRFAMVGVGVAAGVLGKKIISAASDMEETQQKFDVTFSGIKDASNETANQMAKDFGSSQLAMKTMLAGTGDMMTGMGMSQEMAFDLSKEVASLGSDLASFANFAGGAEGATEALTKGLLGEREMMKSLGIVILEEDVKARVKAIKGKKEYINMTNREVRAVATLQMATEQSKNALGDFERSRGSFANQSRIFKASLEDASVTMGQVFLPMATAMVTAMNAMTQVAIGPFIEGLKGKFDRLASSISFLVEFMKTGDLSGEFLRAFGWNEDDTITVFLVGLRKALVRVGEWISEHKAEVITFLKALAVALGALVIITTVIGLLVALTNPIFLVSAAIGLLAVAWSKNMGDIQGKTKATFEWLKGAMEWVSKQWDEWGRGVFETIKTALHLVWGVVKLVFQGIADVFVGFVLFFNGEWGALWIHIKDSAGRALGNLAGIFSDAWELIKTGISGIYDHFVGKFSDMWEKAQEIASKIRKSISEAFDKDKRNSPSIADKVGELTDFVENSQINLTPNVAPVAASTVNQTINAQLSDGVSIETLGQKMRFMMRNQY